MLHKPFSRTDLAAKVTEAHPSAELKLIEEETSHSIGNCSKPVWKLWAETARIAED